eukprot:m.78170 g.78170  ORF g.78170 m.78170 type:complete len:702 (+) comp13240_c1_seq3:179-2284(+)
MAELSYSIFDCSSFTQDFHPSNILRDCPEDKSSRWGAASDSKQYIILKLEAPAIVTHITFGKYKLPHPCNLKDFTVDVGLEPQRLHPVLASSLLNTPDKETFPLAHTFGAEPFACRYIKITPVQPWADKFNFSIWYVGLRGDATPDTVARAIAHEHTRRFVESERLCLKYLRQQGRFSSLTALTQSSPSGVKLEHDIMTAMWTALMAEDYDGAEETLRTIAAQGMLNTDSLARRSKAVWTRLLPLGPPTQMCHETPGPRGGHQMLIDVETKMLYLFGGWDGESDLGDLWAYSIIEQRWECLSRNTQLDGGPAPRSCHKICLDETNKQIYVFGRFVEVDKVGTTPCDFFRFDIASRTWTLLSSDTARDGGPELIFDHQMCMDNVRGLLFIFGGRSCRSCEVSQAYSGLFQYNVKTGEWRRLKHEGADLGVHIPSRVGHSMLLDQASGQLYIFAGQRERQFLNDFYCLDTHAPRATLLSRDTTKQKGPDPCFTQRSTLDPDLHEIHVMSGLVKSGDDESSSSDNVLNSLWLYQIQRNQWYVVEKTDVANDKANVPCPRFAHQFVFDHHTKTHYLFGGNPGDKERKSARLSDFWSMTITRPGPEALVSQCLFEIRKLNFLQQCERNPRAALKYLQTVVSSCVPHDLPAYVAEFRMLSANVLSPTPRDAEAWRVLRQGAFDRISAHVKQEYAQPDASLEDLVCLQ